jgi:uroporphyrinogen III methyltransferase/synthase
MHYVIGTRGSKLAVAQAETVRTKLAETYPKDTFELRIISTKGDLMSDRPLHEIGGSGVFVREIEQQILSGEIQLGVHSMKDMPADPANGLTFAKAWKREDPRDVLILREKRSLWELPQGAVIGTGSKRRMLQLKKLRPDLIVTGIRGNVETRLLKMDQEQLDGIVLAAAGMHRLGMQNRITQYLEADEMVPAPAQGILALEILEKEERLLSMLNALSDPDTVLAAEAERSFLREMGAGCHVPVGAVFRQDTSGNGRLLAMFGDGTKERQAYVSVSGTDPKEMAKQAAAGIRKKLAGTVYLIGAGPGDPGLITAAGLKRLREAGCIVYDRLVPKELLAEAKSGCELIYAGKASRNHTMTQEEIHRLLVKKSMEYPVVVRLKGGDPFVFGRGGEEGLYLRECGVPFTVVPGISSCIAGLAYAGIPVTHRGISRGFHVVTAQDHTGGLAEIDFRAMASGKETCVFLMGLDKIGEIADRLMQAGMPKETKAAVISRAAMPGQKTCVSDLLHIEDAARQAGLVSPAVIAVGEVVALRERLNVWEERPLFGKKFLIPKIGEAPTRLSELLRERGAAVDEVLVGTIAEKKQTFSAEAFFDADWLVFTSRHGVDAFFRNLKENHLDIRCLCGCRLAAVGSKTAEALQGYGVYADLVPDSFHGCALSDTLKKHISPGETVCYFKAADAAGELRLKLAGICRLKEIELYENCPVWPELEEGKEAEDYDGILFTCASSAKRLLEAVGTEWKKNVKAYSIGPKTTECLQSYGVEFVLEAKVCTYETLAELCAEE